MGAVTLRDAPASHEWATPKALFARIEARWGPFDLDPAATPENAKAARFFTREDDGLSRPWMGPVFCNPPYGKGRGAHGDFVRKAIEEVQAGRCPRAVLLVPSATDTIWFAAAWAAASEVIFLTGRPHFNDGKGGGTFASVILVLDPPSDAPRTVSLEACRFAPQALRPPEASADASASTPRIKNYRQVQV